ncbi:Phage-related baseplate assembly protein [Pirellula sp. SH-Sr6A]|uniref:type VI secretion system Vgr family protein n=1 Tax=Pirellula sp. SH-Sr6A TaxID=1632865 RepID=UPI00078C22C7|nr:type VI secretion system tip protein TssI/VgrG [Pirellula sp. SH-Sr6A]AMV33464.1 Phage-related baseplate assembly protein [Pirellula sp. SH-Sr6A]
MSSGVNAQRINKIHGVFDESTIFRKLVAEEHLGRLFSIQVEVLSTKSDISPYLTIGKSVAIEVANWGESRFFHGIISHFELVGEIGSYFLYKFELKPWFWLLTHTSDCRIHQQLDPSKIIEYVFRTKNGLTDYQSKLTKTYKVRDYCVQYRESDFQFASRLMEQEGIYYYFDHSQSDHKMILVDNVSSHAKISGTPTIPFRPPNNAEAADEHIYVWKHRLVIQPGKFVYRDFDYIKPNVNLEVRLNGEQSHPHSSFEHFDYPGLYSETADGTNYVRVLSELHGSQFAQIQGVAKSWRLRPGYVFQLSEHPSNSENELYLIISSRTTITSGEIDQARQDSDNESIVEFVAIKKTQQFRTPVTTPRPIIAGPQTAKVVGKNGEEIWTDNLGRVKVQFPWDREGTSNENSSCWIRVAQIWSGKSWGAMFIPRIGQEVVVEFLEGDPDRPLITGRVYNTDQVVPYALPDQAATSGIKTRSTPSGTAETYNELRFVDKKDEELVYFHAEKDFERVVENNDSLKVGFIKKDKGDQTVDVFNNQTIHVGTQESSDGSQTIEIWKDQKETIKTGDRTTKIEQGNDSLTISAGNQSISIPSGTCTIDAGQKITLQVGGSSIVIDGSSITLKSTNIKIEAGLSAEMTSTTGKVEASATLDLKGGVININ